VAYGGSLRCPAAAAAAGAAGRQHSAGAAAGPADAGLAVPGPPARRQVAAEGARLSAHRSP
jgi:hypothetical protein